MQLAHTPFTLFFININQYDNLTSFELSLFMSISDYKILMCRFHRNLPTAFLHTTSKCPIKCHRQHYAKFTSNLDKVLPKSTWAV